MMFAIELLHSFTPDVARQEAARVYCGAEHLTYAERVDVENIRDALSNASHALGARSMQHVGPVGDALDFGATIASAGEALCSFVLTRALVNPHELVAAKVGIAECQLASSNLLALLDTEEQRKSMAGLAHANEFLDQNVEKFTPLFEDLERQARKRFPHLGPQLDERGNNAVQS
jgi:hypothetical protein